MTFRLLESNRRKRRTPKEAAISVAVHTALIAAFVYATAQSNELSLGAPKSVQSITFAMPKAAPKAPAAAPAPKRQPVPRPSAERSTTPPAPVEETSASSFAGTSTGAGASDTPGDRGAYYDYEVGEVAAALGGGIRPRYPDFLRQSGTEGQVLVEFVVDERGRVDMNTVRVVSSSHDLFAASVKNALRGMRFSPAKVNGVAVRQFVRLPVTFKIVS